MAFVTPGLFPFLIDVFRMYKFESAGSDARNIAPGALGDDGMARIAVAGDDLSLLIFMITVVAAEAAGGDHMADVVGIFFPADLHFREHILAVDPLQGGGQEIKSRGGVSQSQLSGSPCDSKRQ